VALFADRIDAGAKLAEALGSRPNDAVVLGIPRGGVIVAREVADRLNAQLDITIPRKLGAPRNPELGIGAVAADGTRVVDHRLMEMLHVGEEYLSAETERQLQEIRRRLRAYRGTDEEADVTGRVVVVVDDGVATGATAEAAVRSLKAGGAKKLILAVPVAAPEAAARLAKVADEVVTVATPEPFWAVGQWFADFRQVSDEEVIEALRGARR
jgi:putative phosphoribosyl transferase